MTRLDSARATVGRTRDNLSPYASSATKTALHYADEARHRLAPTMATATAQARTGAAQAAHSARRQYDLYVAPQLEQAFAALPPGAQQSTLKAVHRAQEAALAAKISATRAADQARTTMGPRVTDAVEGARSTVLPVAQEAQARGAAALTALQGHVSAAEISELAAKNIKKEQRHGMVTGLAVAGTLAIGAGALAWQWWRRQSNPEWLVEPPTASPAAPLNGSTPMEEAAVPDEPQPKSAPKPSTPPGHDDRPKPHDPRKPH